MHRGVLVLYVFIERTAGEPSLQSRNHATPFHVIAQCNEVVASGRTACKGDDCISHIGKTPNTSACIAAWHRRSRANWRHAMFRQFVGAYGAHQSLLLLGSIMGEAKRCRALLPMHHTQTAHERFPSSCKPYQPAFAVITRNSRKPKIQYYHSTCWRSVH